ncbi:MAG: hypothetical protein ACTSPI_15670 [Candidatus Heimdallarchaeaceae archaeon]
MTPQIKNQKYHEMDFKKIAEIRNKVVGGDNKLLINETELFLYLNRMDRKYSLRLKWLQNFSILSFINMFIVLFINWKLSPLFFVIAIFFHIVSMNKAKQYLYKQCTEDNVFLKFALAVGLVELERD